MADYIRREDAIKAIMGEYPEPHYPSWFAGIVRDIPAVDLSQRGYWDVYWDCNNSAPLYECSMCGASFPVQKDICPDCNAIMDRYTSVIRGDYKP